MLGSPINYSTFDAYVCIPVICKKYDVDVSISSHVLLATIDIVSPSFEKHTISIGSWLLVKMGYTKGGLGKNGNGIVSTITPEMKYLEKVLHMMPLPHYLHLALLRLGNIYLL